ncbi:hypothetical protein PSJ8397_00279 [Pseudooctadecabacter jejudonensis]|uniref:Uncharacterized protein n=1 Tax=Pseudooctadecabacter jejudonensis TaxID=1391910 RepID=A0A1Y5RGT6_9RHOB|nr:hypothetical protein PSJ8397_00279 [Pseudooctadecabacter jejudonensis]
MICDHRLRRAGGDMLCMSPRFAEGIFDPKKRKGAL